MKTSAVVLMLLLAASLCSNAQAPGEDAAQPDAVQQKAARTFASHSAVAKPKPAAKAVALTPLTPRERVVQLLDRFTFGPRPGDVDRVLAQGGDAWLNRQLNPGSVPDGALARRLEAYPTVNMTPQQAILVYPDRAQINQVADGKAPYPTDPMLKAVYEVQVYKLQQEKDKKKADGTTAPPPELTEEQKAAQKKLDQAKASHLFGDLFALPKNQRMNAILKMPVEDRIVLTTYGNLTGDQRFLLTNDFNPREREVFQAMTPEVSSSGAINAELAQARVLRDILSDRQLQAVMTAFWFNHFNVDARKDSDQWYTTSYERDVIRPHALGSFRDLLLATAQSPAMMVYLDNWLSIGPDSLANGVNPQNPKSKRGNKGLNENYGREVMELHTLSVNGGYSQADVTALSAILTGWGVDNPNAGGPFAFDYKRHEPGPKRWFGYVIDEDGKVTRPAPGTSVLDPTFGPSNTVATPDSVKQGIAALNILANAPQTAHFISYLLAQYFVADNPPPALVARLQATFLASHGDIQTVLRALIASPEFNSRQYFHNKVKTPEEFVASAFRATATDPQNPQALVNTLSTMGMPLYKALPPTGYYLTADQWMNSTALIDRLNFAYQLTSGKFANQKFDAPKLLAMGLLGQPAPAAGQPRLVGVAAPVGSAAAAPMPGAETAKRVLEATMIGTPVSAQTNQLMDAQLTQQAASPNPPPDSTATLNLLTALVMGSPEFQLR
jgi:uncharacterized protein (DUF1800 family)